MLLHDVQESMRKRNPDSVSNLIRAATESEEVLEERRLQAQLMVDVKAELAGVVTRYPHTHPHSQPSTIECRHQHSHLL